MVRKEFRGLDVISGPTGFSHYDPIISCSSSETYSHSPLSPYRPTSPSLPPPASPREGTQERDFELKEESFKTRGIGSGIIVCEWNNGLWCLVHPTSALTVQKKLDLVNSLVEKIVFSHPHLLCQKGLST